jgi:hypothetical protein
MMQSKSKILLFAIIFILAVTVISAFLLRSRFSATGEEPTPVGAGDGVIYPPGTLPPVPPPVAPAAGETITVQTPQGGVAIANIYEDPQAQLLPTGVAFKTADYDIYYDKGQGFFGILLASPVRPLSEQREEAEAMFLEKLDISKEEACKLDVYVNVDIEADPVYGGDKNYGLSFCLGSSPL